MGISHLTAVIQGCMLYVAKDTYSSYSVPSRGSIENSLGQLGPNKLVKRTVNMEISFKSKKSKWAHFYIIAG